MFDVLEPDAGESEGQPLPQMVGHTRDISETGLAIVVMSDSPDSHYDELVGRELRIVIDLPDGDSDLRCTVVRVKQLAEQAENSHLIGVRIKQMNDKDWVHMIRYILTLQQST
jgi:c-di-GMP-binding flagellar brake protein YcgR